MLSCYWKFVNSTNYRVSYINFSVSSVCIEKTEEVKLLNMFDDCFIWNIRK